MNDAESVLTLFMGPSAAHSMLEEDGPASEFADTHAELFRRLERARRAHPYIDQLCQHVTQLLEFGADTGAKEDDMFVVLELLVAAHRFAKEHNLEET